LKKCETAYPFCDYRFFDAVVVRVGPAAFPSRHRGKSRKSYGAAGSFFAPDVFRAQIEKVYGAYFTELAALSRDLPGDAKKGAAEIHAALKKIDMSLFQNNEHERWMDHAGVIGRSAKAIAGAKKYRYGEGRIWKSFECAYSDRTGIRDFRPRSGLRSALPHDLQ